MNILTFDIEEWYLNYLRFNDDKRNHDKLDYYLNEILDLLDESKVKGTFFCLGGMATHFSDIVKKIDILGHEVGCHSNKHVWLNKMTVKEVREDTRISIDALEQCIGKKIRSYRAPAFSIGENNIWAFDILVENGIERDASVFPAARDFGGFPNFGHKRPVILSHQGVHIKEFPVCTTKIMGKELAYSGGGYFRFYPLQFIRKEMAKSDYVMTYFHIGDLLPDLNKVMTKEEYEEYFKESGSLKNRYMRYFKENIGKKKAFGKLMTLISLEDFVNLEKADKNIDWVQAPHITL